MKGTDDASGTLHVHVNLFAMYNFKVVNSYGPGNGVRSQALALAASGTEQVRTAHFCHSADSGITIKALFLRVSMAALLLDTKIRFLQIPEHNTLDIHTLRVQ